MSTKIHSLMPPFLTRIMSQANFASTNGNTMNTTVRKAMNIKAIFALAFALVSSHAYAYQLVPLDINSVTTGGTAVQALNQNHRSAGGWLFNPTTATINLCINEVATASGTTSSGSLTCIAPGSSYVLTPNAGPVSVITSDSSHPFSGFGLQP